MLYDAATKTMNVRYSQDISVTAIAAIFGWNFLSKHFIFFVPFECAQWARVLHNTRL